MVIVLFLYLCFYVSQEFQNPAVKLVKADKLSGIPKSQRSTVPSVGHPLTTEAFQYGVDSLLACTKSIWRPLSSISFPVFVTYACANTRINIVVAL